MSEESPETDKKVPAAKKAAYKKGSDAPEPAKGGLTRRIARGILAFSWPIVSFFVASFAVAILAIMASGLTGQPIVELIETDNLMRLIFQVLVMVIVLALVSVPLYRVFFKKDTPWQQVFGFTRRPRIGDAGLALIMYGGYLVSTIAAFVIVSQFIPGIDLEQAQELGVTAPESLWQYILIFITLAVVPPLFEELIFRGFAFKAFRQQYSFWISAVLTSVAFAVIHMQVNVGIDVFILSLFLCYLRERTGSLWAPIFLHGIKNGLAFLLLFVLGVR